MKETDAAYLAGLIDGDSTISVKCEGEAKGNKYSPYVSIANTNREVLEWCKDLIGVGAISTKKTTKKNHEESYAVTWVYDRALYVAEQCLPYLKIKKTRAELVLQWKDCTPRNGYYTEEMKDKKEKLILKIKILNARGRWSNRKKLYETQLASLKPIKVMAQKKKVLNKNIFCTII